MTSTGLRRRLLKLRVVRVARNLRELTRLHQSLTNSPLFAPDFYARQRGRRLPTKRLNVLDYLLVGAERGLLGGPLLLPGAPRSSQRLGLAGTGEWARILRTQGFPDRPSHPAFDLDWYADTNSLSPTEHPLAHYLTVRSVGAGRTSPRQAEPADLVELANDAISGKSMADPVPADRASVGRPGSPAVISVLIPLGQSWGERAETFGELLKMTTGDTEVVVLPPPLSTPETDVVLSALATLAGFVIAPASPTQAMGERLDTALAVSKGETIVVIWADCAIEPRLIAELAATARPGVMAEPTMLSADGTIATFGLDKSGTGQLAGHPLADAARAGTAQVFGISAEVLAISRADLRACGGFGRAADPRAMGADLAARFTQLGGRLVVLGQTTATLRTTPTAPPHFPAPGFVRSGRTRWAIKSPHPAGARGRTWGDYHFAMALARALERAGQEVAVDPLDSWYRQSDELDEVVIVLRGLHRYRSKPGKVTVLWVISHPELVTADEIRQADLAYAASAQWAATQTDRGISISPLLQCTDPAVFDPARGDPGTGWPVLFVGNSRGAHRPLVQAASRLRPDLAIIGSGWDGRVPASQVKSTFLANTDLAAAYRSAGVVLNDHWPDMAAAGFMSNRLFDLTAAGARWVSDPVSGLAELFPTGRTAANATELERLLTSPELFPGEDELASAAQAVRAQHSFDARAATLVAAVSTLLQRTRA